MVILNGTNSVDHDLSKSLTSTEIVAGSPLGLLNLDLLLDGEGVADRVLDNGLSEDSGGLEDLGPVLNQVKVIADSSAVRKSVWELPVDGAEFLDSSNDVAMG